MELRKIKSIWANWLIKVIHLFIQILDYLWPKDNHIWVFGSNNGRKVDGSPKALYDKLCTDPTLTCYFLSKENKPGYNILPFKSLRPLFIFLRARYLVISHGIWDLGFLKPSSKKKIIETWHGIPVKRIGFSQKQLPSSEKEWILNHARLIDSFLVSSQYAADIFNEALRVDQQKFLLIGQPRNDILIRRESTTPVSTIIPDLDPDTFLILYAPTFRDSGENPFFRFPDLNLQKLNTFLENRGITILVRPHISEINSVTPFLSDRIRLFSSEQCAEVNEVLTDINLLITDYSSIFIDFLLLDRPIFFSCFDLNQYSKTGRGDLLYKDYLNWIPGLNVLSQMMFMRELTKLLDDKKDDWSDRREELKKLYHSHQTSDTATKLLNHYLLDE